uniref:Alcohol dehydrogenase, zinc-binding domain protein n=1 Tax=Rhodopseudomonas palustris (strain BisA53) TaxID=316055 RepID=Q07P89_RHOP5
MPQAVVCRALGPPESLRLEQVARPALRAGEVRVKVAAAGINFPDILMCAGEYQLKPELPFVPGVEVSGEVIEIGEDVRDVAIGAKVIAKMRFGGYADEVVVDAKQLSPWPAGFDAGEAATFLAGHGTAWHALVERGHLQPGEVLLVHGAGGGVGLAAVELGKLLGAEVIATASSDAKLAMARERGADHLIRYDREPFRDAVKRITQNRGADLVFDPVGGEVFEQSLRCIAWGARILVVGFTGGIGLARTNLVLMKGASIVGVRAGEAMRRDPKLGAARLKALYDLAAEGRIKPHVSHRLPLARFAEAMRLLTDRQAIGRVALTIS